MLLLIMCLLIYNFNRLDEGCWMNIETLAIVDLILNNINNVKNLLASLAHSHRAQLASLARMSAPGARDLMVVALRVPTYMNFALRAQYCVLRSA